MHVLKISLFFVLTFIMIMVVVTSCSFERQNLNTSSVQESTNESARIPEHNYVQLFYGEWEVMEDLCQRQEPSIEITGQRLFYKKDEIVINGGKHIPVTEYTFKILPINMESYGYSLENYNFKGDYFVEVGFKFSNYYSTASFLSEKESTILLSFVIINDDKLALVGPTHLIEMKRISHYD